MLLTSHRIAGGKPGPHLLITGGVHGDEFEPMAAIRRLIRELDPASLCGTVTLVPVVNEPAFRRGQRTAEDGLDLARTCPGRADGSITEQIACALSDLIRTADYYIDLHTGGTRLRVLPLAGYMLHPDRTVLAIQRRMARAFGLPIVWGTDPHLDGRSLSVARDARIPAIYTEYHGGGGCDWEGIEAYVRGCRGVLRELGMLNTTGSPPQSANGPGGFSPPEPLCIEDPRQGAGHMQINHPSPQEGFFEPAVALGQRVAAGDRLGTVTDLLGIVILPIPAACGGLVLVLHTFSRVEAGTSLGVILEVPEGG
ncbi:MAG: succinylglutamate desuccinylase/aspartoacylase family protein [Planctomycetales bacterium]